MTGSPIGRFAQPCRMMFRRSHRALRALGMASLLLLLLPALGLAHHLAAPKVDLVSVSAKEIRIAVDYSVDLVQSDTLRGLYDRDRDGRIGADEAAPAEAWLRLAATNFLGVEIDGQPLALRELAVELRGMDGRGALGGMFVLSAPVSLGKGAHRMELRDRHKDASIAVPVRVTFARGLESDAPDTPVSLDAQMPSLAIDFRAQ